MDLRLVGSGFNYDLAIKDGDFELDASLRSSVLMSLITNGRADDTEIPAGADPQGWFGSPHGSKFWLLLRSKITPATPELARRYALESLQWMINEGVAIGIDVTAERLHTNTIVMTVTIKRSDETLETHVFSDLWAEISDSLAPPTTIHPNPIPVTITYFLLTEGNAILNTENGERLVWR